jgi:transcription factor TFB4
MSEGSRPNLDDANKYRPFALIEEALLSSLRELISSTTETDVATTTTTQMAGALTLALSYVNKATMSYSGVSTESKPASTSLETSDTLIGLQSRILVISVSGDLAHQYIPIMNTTFAAQRLRIPIDILKLAGDTVFLQQASDATRGIYMQLRNPQGLLQYLMMAFLPDQVARKHLITPTQEVVDFRAACFCHRKVVDVGFVCSICLSSKYAFYIHVFGLSRWLGNAEHVSSLLLASGRGHLSDLFNSPGIGRLRFETSGCTKEEEEEEEGQWGRYWERPRNSGSRRLSRHSQRLCSLHPAVTIHIKFKMALHIFVTRDPSIYPFLVFNN